MLASILQFSALVPPEEAGALTHPGGDKAPKDGGQWQNTDYYFPEELSKLQLVAAKCFEYISLTESKDSEEQVPV